MQIYVTGAGTSSVGHTCECVCVCVSNCMSREISVQIGLV